MLIDTLLTAKYSRPTRTLTLSRRVDGRYHVVSEYRVRGVREARRIARNRCARPAWAMQTNLTPVQRLRRLWPWSL